jgi:hypothetical protein
MCLLATVALVWAVAIAGVECGGDMEPATSTGTAAEVWGDGNVATGAVSSATLPAPWSFGAGTLAALVIFGAVLLTFLVILASRMGRVHKCCRRHDAESTLAAPQSRCCVHCDRARGAPSAASVLPGDDGSAPTLGRVVLSGNVRIHVIE